MPPKLSRLLGKLSKGQRNKMSHRIDYEEIVENSMRSMVRTILRKKEKYPDMESHYFFVSFDTDHRGVILSDRVRSQYRGIMSVILQNQFSNLRVSTNYFDVDLSFGGEVECVRVPFRSILFFADPHAGFELKLHSNVWLEMDDYELYSDEYTDMLMGDEANNNVDIRNNLLPLDKFTKLKK